ncbi:hypothetical protein PSQ90_03800 [Devosia rhodophyticola]|uniref:Uncharacterized protein n=1 Tax=Devosia rhodophyticola TaxID=3026423 RepID=A0ABY7YZV2_9HYPH|nr:hypothetical protein [Devosia rhodophyticola]WDR06598.1 hypothetical protein PSQ90_03800 [Devosia rhodophyticola]
MMRALVLVVMLVCAIPALASDWGYYSNARFGYGIDIPPDFTGLGESDNGDGQRFERTGRAQILVVWGGNALAGFGVETAERIGYLAPKGWNVTYQATTPTWASFSAVAGQRVLYQRMIALCGGQQYAAFQLKYSMIDIAKMNAVVEQLVASLSAETSRNCQ